MGSMLSIALILDEYRKTTVKKNVSSNELSDTSLRVPLLHSNNNIMQTNIRT